MESSSSPDQTADSSDNEHDDALMALSSMFGPRWSSSHLRIVLRHAGFRAERAAALVLEVDESGKSPGEFVREVSERAEEAGVVASDGDGGDGGAPPPSSLSSLTRTQSTTMLPPPPPPPPMLTEAVERMSPSAVVCPEADPPPYDFPSGVGDGDAAAPPYYGEAVAQAQAAPPASSSVANGGSSAARSSGGGSSSNDMTSDERAVLDMIRRERVTAEAAQRNKQRDDNCGGACGVCVGGGVGGGGAGGEGGEEDDDDGAGGRGGGSVSSFSLPSLQNKVSRSLNLPPHRHHSQHRASSSPGVIKPTQPLPPASAARHADHNDSFASSCSSLTSVGGDLDLQSASSPPDTAPTTQTTETTTGSFPLFQEESTDPNVVMQLHSQGQEHQVVPTGGGGYEQLWQQQQQQMMMSHHQHQQRRSSAVEQSSMMHNALSPSPLRASASLGLGNGTGATGNSSYDQQHTATYFAPQQSSPLSPSSPRRGRDHLHRHQQQMLQQQQQTNNNHHPHHGPQHHHHPHAVPPPPHHGDAAVAAHSSPQTPQQMLLGMTQEEKDRLLASMLAQQHREKSQPHPSSHSYSGGEYNRASYSDAERAFLGMRHHSSSMPVPQQHQHGGPRRSSLMHSSQQHRSSSYGGMGASVHSSGYRSAPSPSPAMGGNNEHMTEMSYRIQQERIQQWKVGQDAQIAQLVQRDQFESEDRQLQEALKASLVDNTDNHFASKAATATEDQATRRAIEESEREYKKALEEEAIERSVTELVRQMSLAEVNLKRGNTSGNAIDDVDGAGGSSGTQALHPSVTPPTAVERHTSWSDGGLGGAASNNSSAGNPSSHQPTAHQGGGSHVGIADSDGSKSGTHDLRRNAGDTGFMGVVNVRNAGIDAANGTYSLSGSSDGVGKYCNEAKWEGQVVLFALYRCLLRNNVRRWFISMVVDGERPGTDEVREIYVAPGTSDERLTRDEIPPETGWSVIPPFGEGPAPLCLFDNTIMSSENATGDTSIQLENAGFGLVNGTYERTDELDGVGMYTRDAIWSGKKVTVTLHRSLLRGDGRRWFISLVPRGRKPGSFLDTDLYFSDSIPEGGGVEGEKPPSQGWRSIRGFGQDPPPVCRAAGGTNGISLPASIPSAQVESCGVDISGYDASYREASTNRI